MYRQGDVLIVKADGIPKGLMARKENKVILALGEVTGHHHRFEGGSVTAFYKEGDKDFSISGGGMLRGGGTDVQYISVSAPAELLHEEHDTICVPPGKYRIVRQREFDVMEGVRRVAD